MARQRELPVHMRRDRFDPVPELGRLRAQTPLAELDLSVGPARRIGWLATGYDEVRHVLADSSRFSTLPPADNRADSQRLVQVGNLLQYDPPEHTRLRRMLTPEFTVRRMRRLEPRIGSIVEECLDHLEQAGPPADLMAHLAWALPALATCELLGVPRDDRAELARLADQHRDAARGRARQNAAGKGLQEYMTRLALQQRREPGEDLIGMLVREHGDELTDEELAGLGTFLLGAGFDNMAAMLGLGVLVLLEHPGQLAQLRERPELVDHAVEELLRYLTVIPTASPRTATEDLVIGGRQVRSGERVFCSLLAANRPDGDDFDLTRESTGHVAFGHGVHHCLGAPLARMQLRTAYLALVRRFPGLRTAVPAEEIRFRPSQSRSYGIDSLPVTW